MLKFTMETIFAQTYRPVEVLIVDDGSTDGTGELLESYGDRIRYFRKEKSGIAETRTVACKLAEGEYIAFQDDDDLMPPNRIGLLYDALCQYPDAIFALGDWAFIDADGRSTGKRSTFQIKPENEAPILIEDGYEAVLYPLVTPLPHTTLFRKDYGERIDWFDSATFFHACSDTDFFARLGQLGPIVYLPKIVSYYRMGHAQIWGNSFLSEYSRFLLFEKHLKAENGSRNKLKQQLQLRILGVLQQTANLRRSGVAVSSSVPNDFVSRGLALLGARKKLSYWFHTGLRLPVRSLIKGRGQ